MSKPLSFFNLVFVFIYQISLAQNTPELINSGDLIAQGTKLSDDGKYKEAIQLYSKISRSDTNYSAACMNWPFHVMWTARSTQA
jgi:hypothetical protein